MQWEWLELPLTVLIIRTSSWVFHKIQILFFQFRPGTGSYCYKMLVLLLFQHILMSINSAFAPLTNLILLPLWPSSSLRTS